MAQSIPTNAPSNLGPNQSIRRSLIGHLTLRPHGDRLLTSGAAFWLLGVQIIVLAMATAEAIAWGYLGYLFGNGYLSWVVSILTGLVIFFVIWMIDINLMTLDRSSEEHAELIFGEKIKTSTAKARTWLAISTRILIVLGSLTITAPYLAQLVFHKEIDQWIRQATIERLAGARAALENPENPINQSVIDREQLVAAKRDQLVLEVAGKGVSGRHGDGTTANSIRVELNKMESELAAALAVREEEVRAFESLVAQWDRNREELAARYGLSLPEKNILSSREALNSLRERPEHQETELAIKAFLSFIFLGLLILKLFEPRSIRLYLSEVLQLEYTRYLAGSFDNMLSDSEKASKGGKGMTAQRLYDFLVNVWAPKRSLQVYEAEKNARKSAAQEDLQQLNEVLQRLELKLGRAYAQFQKESVDAEAQVAKYESLLSALSYVKGHVGEFTRQSEAISEPSSNFDPQAKLVYETEIKRRLAEAQRKLQDLQWHEPTEKAKVERMKKALEETENELKERKLALKQIEEQIRQHESLLLNQFRPGQRMPVEPS